MSTQFGEMKLGSAVKLVELVKVQGVVKVDSDLSAGGLVCNDGSGFVQATYVLSQLNQTFVVEHDHNYASAEASGELSELKHSVSLYAKGVVVVQKVVGAAWVKGQKLKVGTSGKATRTAAASDAMIGTAAMDAEEAADRGIIRLGQ